MEERARDKEGMEQQEEDLTRLLPADVLVEVLRRLPHRGLAVSRCMCKAWHSAIDARRLMLRHLLPHSLGGIYLRFCGFYTLQFLACPTTDDPKIPTRLGYLPPTSDLYGSGYPYGNSFDHCNGLLLLDDAVVNPATGKWADLPPHPSLLTESDDLYKYLVFDPTVSMHFEVISMDRLSYLYGPDPAIQASEWPASPHVMHVFSSRTWQWEERSFLGEGEAAGTIGDMRPLCPLVGKGYAVFWKGELYVQCESNFVMRISLSNRKYRVIKPPIEIETGLCLGKSEKGVYCALLDCSNSMCQLRVWVLNEELCGQMEWVLKHQADLQVLLMHHKINKQTEGPWILQDTTYYQPRNGNGEEETMADTHHRFVSFLGFHPYKEVVFSTHSLRRGLAYDLSSSKVGDLGNMYPRSYPSSGYHGWIKESFPYTPCWVEEFPLQT